MVKKFVATMKSEAPEVEVFSFHNGLKGFADQAFHKCDYYLDNKEDMISELEQEICARSKGILGTKFCRIYSLRTKS